MLSVEFIALVAVVATAIAIWYWYQTWHADKRLVYMMPDTAFMVDQRGIVLHANAQMLALLKQTEASIVGLPMLSILPEWKETLVAGCKKDIHTEVSRQNQDYEILSHNYYTGANQRTIIILRNITDRKRSQKALQNYLEKMSMLHQVDNEVSATLDFGRAAMLAMDAGLRTSNADAGYLALLDGEVLKVTHIVGAYKRIKIGDPVRYDHGIAGRVLELQEAQYIADVHKDLDHEIDIENTRRMMVFPLVAQSQLIGIMTLETSDPARFNELLFDWMKVVMSRLAMALENARLYKIVRQQLDETRQLYDDKSQLEQIKTDMIRIASHDLKNPVSIVQGYLTLFELDAEQLSEEHHSFLKEMQRATSRMFTILEDILSLERIQNAADANAFDIVPMLHTVYQEHQPQALLKEQDFMLDIPEGASHIVTANNGQLYEAITNLVSNALKYTPNGGQIRITLAHDEASKTITVRIIDTGYGIPADRLDRLFEPFYRAKADETLHIEGTGLGLHLVKNIVERYRGKMLFETVYRQGSTFGFTLPLTL